ncbi:AAA family ATPase [Pseudomonas viridiflava]|uniref:AAA family ATPase n=1 Tax=Pseudomonas syringae group TaxID=136849 RepID=UPI00069B07CA|nr:AAA family ATPase [Pseudomonas viridiflava]MEE4333876.1 AAA family ATPase [Pseudomonas alliivorans]
MKIKHISVTNYRGLECFDMRFEKDITIIVGENGSGKSSVVSAVKLLLWAYIKSYGKDIRRGTVPTIKAEDVLSKHGQQQYPCSVRAEPWFSEDGVFQRDWDDIDEIHDADDFDVDEFALDWSEMYQISCSVNNSGAKCKWKNVSMVAYHAASKGMDAIWADIQKLTGQENDTPNLPVIAFYGTNRLWKKNAGRRSIHREIPRLAGYDGAVNVTTSFMGFSYFVGNLFSSVYAGLFDKNYATILWLGVRDAVKNVTGWKLILPRKGESELYFEQSDAGKLKLSQLGDGARGLIQMVGDLACRCALLNPHFGAKAAEKTDGIVLIDEIDLHLHPAWQQTILNDLKQAFPCIQFIVTTHSPQVLSTVRRDNIRILGRDSTNRVIAGKPYAQSYGEPAGDVLQGVMLVDPLPPVPERVELQHLTSLVEQGYYDKPEAVLLMTNLSQVLGEKHPQLLRLQRSIFRQRALSQ